MAIERRIGTKVNKSMRREDTPAIRIDPHPYIGIVKNNADTIRAGRLQVWIPEFGGDQDDPKNWRTVNYASPFMGSTDVPRTPNSTNSWENVPHTYGMWMVPPDIGVEVIVLFIGGDPLRGYWIACVNSNLSHYMLPAMGSSVNIDPSAASLEVKKGLVQGMAYPVAEFNDSNISKTHVPSFYNNPKPIHEYQASILKRQGLDRDTIRGTISSSSQRETPSNVFGISTPGRPLNDLANDPQLAKKINEGTLQQSEYAVKTRVGGHTFVMDDGTVTGQDQLIRLRSSHGHQLMMNDSANTFYIANADGTVWIELTAEGRLDVYSAKGINFRTQGTLNLHADSNVNINAGGSFNVRAGGKAQINSQSLNILTNNNITIGSGGTVGINTSGGFNVKSTGISMDANGANWILNGKKIENSTAGVDVKRPDPIKMHSLGDTEFDTASGLYKITPGALHTIVTIAPSHEPFYLRPVPGTAAYFNEIKGAAEAGTAPKEAENAAGTQPQSYKGNVDATKNLSGSGVNRAAQDSDLQKQLDQLEPKKGIGPLSKDDLTAYLAQLGKSESSHRYGIQKGQYLGKYQIGIVALKDMGYIKDSVTDASQLDIPSNWVGGPDKPNNKDEYLNSPDLQEKAVWEYTNKNYSYLVANGGITKEMSKEEIAGMLSTAHLLGAGGANTWRTSGVGADANGTTGGDYFQRGKYAVSVLAPKVGTLRNG